jgi:hypothetical protein
MSLPSPRSSSFTTSESMSNYLNSYPVSTGACVEKLNIAEKKAPPYEKSPFIGWCFCLIFLHKPLCQCLLSVQAFKITTCEILIYVSFIIMIEITSAHIHSTNLWIDDVKLINTLTIWMHQMHISTTQVSSVMLRSKKLEIWGKKCENQTNWAKFVEG